MIIDSFFPLRFSFGFTIIYQIRFCFGTELDSIVHHFFNDAALFYSLGSEVNLPRIHWFSIGGHRIMFAVFVVIVIVLSILDRHLDVRIAVVVDQIPEKDVVPCISAIPRRSCRQS